MDQLPDYQTLGPAEMAGRLKVVLCQPNGSRNVGAVCRAMGSMGYSQLSIAGRAKKFFQRNEVLAMAVNSAYFFDCAEFSEHLEPVVQDCSLVVGLTRRRGSRRKYFSLTPEQLREQIEKTPGKIALLFGNERAGLSDKELSYANVACHIPTHPQQASLNLSHSVQIILYELSKLQTRDSGLVPLTQIELRQLSERISTDMQAMGLVDRLQNQRTEIFLHDIFSRARLSQSESQRLLRIFQTLRYRS